MNEELTLARAGANLVKHFESCMKHVGPDRFTAYKCPAGVVTIGWGHTSHHGRKVSMGDVWSQRECDAEFKTDMHIFERDVHRLVKVPLKQWQFDALVSFAYNCGAGNLAASTLLKKVNARNFEGAALEFQRWNKANGKVMSGLVRRRASEALLFQNLPDNDYDGKIDKVILPLEDTMPQKVDAP